MPAIASPAGSEPLLPSSYIDYNNASGILTVVGLVTALALVTVLLRVYVRAVALKVFGLDDWLMVLAMLLSIMVLVCFVEETHHGLGRHLVVALSDPSSWRKFQIWNWAHAIIIMISNSTLKMSIAFFLMRFTKQTRYHRFLWAVILFIVLFTLACFGTLLFQCLPVQAAWDDNLRPPPFGDGTARCYSLTVFRDIGVFNSCIIMATDVLFAILPVPLIWSLQLNTRQKISLICTFSLGFFSCAASLVKTVLQYNFLKNLDWTIHDSFEVWFAVEVNVGIVAASLPALKPVLSWILDPAKRAFSGSPGVSDLGSRDSVNRSRKVPSAFAGRFGNGRSASSLGYLKQASDKTISMDVLDATQNTRPEDFGRDRKESFEVSVSRGDIYPSSTVGTAVTIESRGERSAAMGWFHDGGSKGGTSDTPDLGRVPDERGGILRTTEVRFG